jgi:hypothetical protein
MALAVGLLGLLWCGLATAASISLEVSSRSITIEDELTLEMRIEGGFDRLIEPTLDGFNVTGQTSSRQVVLGGGASQNQLVIRRTLQPLRAGTLTIGQARLIDDNRIVAEAGPIAITVSEPRRAAPAAPGSAADVDKHEGEPFFILPVLSEQRVYEGQPFVLSFDLWVRSNVRAEARGFGEMPKLTGFAIEDVLQGNNPRSRKRLGRNIYQVITLKRDILVPLQAGPATIDPLELQLVAGDVFVQRQYDVRSEPVALTVLEVPEAGRPAAFQAGNVGRFTVAAELGESSPAVGERLVLAVKVEGEGNLPGVKAPQVPPIFGATVEPLPGAAEDDVIKDAAGMQGSVQFHYIVTPTKPGPLTIPAIPFAAFDPRSQRFVESQTVPVTVQVEEASGVGVATPTDEQALKPIATGTTLSDRDVGGRGPTPLVWALLVAPLLLFVGVEARHQVHRRMRSQASVLRSRRALQTARGLLRDAETQMRQRKVKEFFSATSAALLRYVEDRFGLPAQGLTHDALRTRLVAEGVPEPLCSALVTELENCDFARFAPASTREDEMRQSLDRAATLLAEIDGEASRRPTAREGRHAA